MPEEKEKVFTGADLVQMRDQLKNDRDIFISLREVCRFFYKPQDVSSYNFGNQSAGKQAPINTTGIRAHTILASGLYSNTINLSDEFFGFQVADKELSEIDSIQDWFAKCSEIAIAKLGASNYGLSTFETISDYVAVCTGVQYSEMTDDKGLRFQNFMIDHCSIAEDADGRVDHVFRDFQLTAVQAVQLFSIDNVPESIRKKYDEPKTRFEKDRYIHCVFPRPSYTEAEFNKLDNTTFKYVSYYVFEADSKKIDRAGDKIASEVVSEGGYHSFPYAVPRFERNYDNPYGRGVAFSAKGAMSALDYLTAVIDDAVELRANPPVFLPVGANDQNGIDLTPAAENFYNPAFGMPIFYVPDIDVPGATARQQEMEQKLLELFYADLFLMLEERKNMTATEVAERVSEKTQSILPVIARLYDELYSVTLERVFYLLLNANHFPEMPQELADIWGNQQLRVHYTTKLDMKLAQLEIGQVMKSLSEMGALLEIRANMPELESVLKVDELLKDIARKNSVSPDYIRSDEETQEINDAAAEAAQQQQMAEQQAQMIKPLDAQAPIQEGSPLAEQQAGMAGMGNLF